MPARTQWCTQLVFVLCQALEQSCQQTFQLLHHARSQAVGMNEIYDSRCVIEMKPHLDDNRCNGLINTEVSASPASQTSFYRLGRLVRHNQPLRRYNTFY
jgi:hypothetical protein